MEQLVENVENLKPLLEDVRACSEATEVVELIDKWHGDPGAYVRQKVPFDLIWKIFLEREKGTAPIVDLLFEIERTQRDRSPEIRKRQHHQPVISFSFAKRSIRKDIE